MATPDELTAWRGRWMAAGLPTIPITPGTQDKPKGKPVSGQWQRRPTAEQWQDAGPDFDGNIAVVCGEGRVCIDADNKDDPQTSARVEAYLSGLGLDLQTVPTVATYSGIGRHFYLVSTGEPPGGAYANLAPSIGTGELRYGRGAYVMAPCSTVNGRHYHFVASHPEALRRLRGIPWKALLPLIGTAAAPRPQLDAPPVALRKAPAQDRALLLLRALAVTDGPRRPFMGYVSRSEAEAAVVAMLILAGRDFAEIAATFARSKPGHYREHPKPEDYLARTYRHALADVAADPTRQTLAELYDNAAGMPWDGGGGGLDFAVYRALVASAWAVRDFTVQASHRQLAEDAAASPHGVHNALERLVSRGLIRKAAPWHPDPLRGNVWEVRECTIREHVVTVGEPLGEVESDGKTKQGKAKALNEANPELWARPAETQAIAALGKSALLVYVALGRHSGPLRIAELAHATGKHRNTVSAALGRLEAWGLAAQDEGKRWALGAADPADVAEAIRADEQAKRRRQAHELQRAAFLGDLERGGDGGGDGLPE
jgi:predicted transcriptional regulator